MATDKERREIADKLRVAAGGEHDEEYHDLCAILDCAGIEGGVCMEDAFNRLADLIEPSCDREALLVLADKMLNQQYMREDARSLRWDEAARRIREACGLEED